jgi:glycosyltransferase involved in cell wall biosynthesis
VGVSNASLFSVFGSNWKKSEKIRLIYNGIDLRRFAVKISSEDAKKELGIPINIIVYGHVGQFRKEKNHLYFIEIAKQLIKTNKDFVFLLVGDGVMLESIKKATEESDLRKYFIFTGAREDVNQILNAMDLFIYPSLYEGFGIALIEAQAAGLPVVASDAIPDELPLIKPSVKLSLNNVNAWVLAIEDIFKKLQFTNIDRNKIIIQNQNILKEFSIQTWVNKIEALYQV